MFEADWQNDDACISIIDCNINGFVHCGAFLFQKGLGLENEILKKQIEKQEV